MVESSTSSLTSTSHTLTVGAASMASTSFPSLSDISSALAFRDAIRKSNRESFLKPQVALPTASAQIAQVALSSFAGDVADEQQERLRLQHAETAARKKRKLHGHGAAAAPATKNGVAPVGPILRIRRLHVEGFETPQIWEQSKRILAAAVSQAEHELEKLDEEDEEDEEDAEDEEAELDSEAEPSEIGSSEEEEEEEEGEEEDDEEAGDESLAEDLEEEEDDKNGEDDEGLNEPDAEFVEDENGLNDGFFDIDAFNKQSGFFEDQDARADPNTDRADDEEEVDWHADPFSAAAKPAKRKPGKTNGKGKNGRDQLYSDDEEEEDEEEEEGPIFGDMDLDAPSGESDNEDLDAMDGGLEAGLESGLDMDLTANDIFYKDFFAPPPKKRKAGDRPPRPAAGAPEKPFQPDMRDVERAMADVHRDLFDEISEASGSDDEYALSDVSESDPRSRMSTHERKQAKILKEIQRLEAEAVKEKTWTMSGEASGGARPINSLLEEQLEFEHIGKPVPVVTQETTEDIEALVKRRILTREFDEVRRRYTTGHGDDSTRRGLAEVDDRPGQKSLAAIYDEDSQQQANPDAFVSQSDERRLAEEREVERMWADVSAQLDALSNWRYKPRPAAPSMTVVTDVATVAMEDAQPATAQGVSGTSMLAPQEVYKPGAKGEVGDGGAGDGGNIVTVAKSGLPVARDEMSREEKKRRRRRNKERIRKSGSGLAAAHGAPASASALANGSGSGSGDGGKGASKKAQDRQDTLAALKSAGVRVIGRKGEIQDLDGNETTTAKTRSSGHFKL